jgi:conjugal transfer mating pair stabilization protein TraG
MKKTAPLFLAITSCLLLADTALALNMEFYTYGGFNPIVQAFNKIALIFSDANYVSLLTVLTIIGIVSGGISWLATAATGTKIIPLAWLIPVVCGAVLYLGLFIPKGNITVYDPVLNRFQTIGSIPDAIVLAAGSLNKIERGVVDIIDTSAAPNAGYSQTAGGTGFKALEAIKDSSPKDNYARTSMIRYIKDCVTFELLRPGTTLSLDNLRNTSTDFLTDLAQAVNPAVFTVYYDSANPAGTAMSCTTAWNNLRPIYANPANYNESIKKVCSKSYFDPSNATELTTCQNLLSNTVNFTTGSTYTPARIIQQHHR